MKLAQYAKEREIGYRAAWDRYHAGKIPGAYMDETGHIIVPDKATTRLKYAAVYARVSSHDQKDDLARQAARLSDYAVANGLQVVAVVTEVASGVNDTRPKLTKLLEQDDWGTLVIEHRDRLTRVGFNWFVTLFKTQGRQIEVAAPAVENTTDIMEDFLSIMYSFAARMYGKRGAKTRARTAAAAMQSKTQGIS